MIYMGNGVLLARVEIDTALSQLSAGALAFIK